MPSSSLIPAMLGSPMQIAYPASYRPTEIFISWLSAAHCAVGEEFLIGAITMSSLTYQSANRALGFPFQLGEPFTVRKVWWVNGTTATTDSADVAVYTEDGATRLVAGGGATIATANVVQEIDVTDTVLLPGRYWCVYNQNGLTATPLGLAATSASQRLGGCAQFAGAVPLGTTFTPAASLGSVFPLFGIAARTQVA